MKSYWGKRSFISAGVKSLSSVTRRCWMKGGDERWLEEGDDKSRFLWRLRRRQARVLSPGRSLKHDLPLESSLSSEPWYDLKCGHCQSLARPTLPVGSSHCSEVSMGAEIVSVCPHWRCFRNVYWVDERIVIESEQSLLHPREARPQMAVDPDVLFHPDWWLWLL